MTIYRVLDVAPLAGAWIEIENLYPAEMSAESSLPLRERGLKLVLRKGISYDHFVAPLAGAWIEIALL